MLLIHHRDVCNGRLLSSVTGITQQMIDPHPISRRILLILLLVASASMDAVRAHGRLLDPPSRSSAWRVGFNTPKDYNDMEAFCGGFGRQWLVNKGKCGICGDPYDERIKPHEAPGGIFATGTIVRTYRQGQVIQITLQLTAVHKGFYEFKLCPNNNPRQDPSQECFDRFPLRFVDDGGRTRFFLNNLQSGTYRVRLQLPAEVTCSQCILQWTYTTGNRWGICPNGTGALGCGPQETFRACADVAISPSGIAAPAATNITTGSMNITAPPTNTTTNTTTIPPTPTVPAPRPSGPFIPDGMMPTVPAPRPSGPFIPDGMKPTTPTPTTPTPAPTQPIQPPVAPVPVDPGSMATGCYRYVPVGMHQGMAGMDSWCENNCRRGYCPPDYCRCAERQSQGSVEEFLMVNF